MQYKIRSVEGVSSPIIKEANHPLDAMVSFDKNAKAVEIKQNYYATTL